VTSLAIVGEVATIYPNKPMGYDLRVLIHLSPAFLPPTNRINSPPASTRCYDPPRLRRWRPRLIKSQRLGRRPWISNKPKQDLPRDLVLDSVATLYAPASGQPTNHGSRPHQACEQAPGHLCQPWCVKGSLKHAERSCGVLTTVGYEQAVNWTCPSWLSYVCRWMRGRGDGD
jgi:hypothetical protein